jgi:hypothetical protein
MKFQSVFIVNNSSSLSMTVFLYILSRRTYGLLFDWLYPAHMPLLLKGISRWTDTPEVGRYCQILPIFRYLNSVRLYLTQKAFMLFSFGIHFYQLN